MNLHPIPGIQSSPVRFPAVSSMTQSPQEGKCALKLWVGKLTPTPDTNSKPESAHMAKFHHNFFFLKSSSKNKKTGENVNPWLSDPLFAKPTKKMLNSKFLHVFYGSCSKVSSTNLLPVSKDRKWFYLEREEESILILERGFQWLTVPRILP